MVEIDGFKEVVKKVVEVVKSPGPHTDLEIEFLDGLKGFYEKKVAKSVAGLVGEQRIFVQEENARGLAELMTYAAQEYIGPGRLDPPDLVYAKLVKSKKDAEKKANQASEQQ